MDEELLKTTEQALEFFKKRAERLAKTVFTMQEQAVEENSKEAPKPWKCASCIWVFDCDTPNINGCEQYETKVAAIR